MIHSSFSIIFFQLDEDAFLLNNHQVETSPKDNGYVESSQDYTIIPRPELDGQNLYCVHTQVCRSGLANTR